MEGILNFYDKIALKFRRLISLKYFWPIYSLTLALFTAVGWKFFSIYAMMLLILIAVVFLVFTDDMMYTLPSMTYVLFAISDGFSNKEFPIPIIIVVSLCLFIFILYTFLNGVKLKKLKSFWPFLLLGILNFVPIFWNNVIEKENSVFYFLYFASIGYFLLYILFCSGLKKVNLKGVIYTFSFLGLLLSLQCGYRVGLKFVELYQAGLPLGEIVNSIFDMWYHLGWGLCNEAGIMICFSLPFTFYLLLSSKTLKGMILQTIMAFISIMGVLFTTSRGSYLCAAVISVGAFISMFFVGENKKLSRNYAISLLVILVGGFLLCHKITFPLVSKMIDKVFNLGINSNGRVEIWNQGINAWKQNPLTMILGPGICSVLEFRASGYGDQLIPLVFHSTLLESLAVGGLSALAVLGWHLFLKYKYLFKTKNKTFVVIMTIGFLALDLYGMIDNTYFMYYYMIPLMLLISTLEINDLQKK